MRVVYPGETPPTDFNETTLYFAPGVHNLTHVPACCSTTNALTACQCVNNHADASHPGYVAPYPLRSGKRLHIPADAWLDGWLLSEAQWGIEGANITGYGVLSGRRMRWKQGDYLSLRAIQLNGAVDCHIVGPTLVDFPNHHLVIVGAAGAAAGAKPNTLQHVKVVGWRANGDGVHIWGHWNEVSDLFIRTQVRGDFCQKARRATDPHPACRFVRRTTVVTSAMRRHRRSSVGSRCGPTRTGCHSCSARRTAGRPWSKTATSSTIVSSFRTGALQGRQAASPSLQRRMRVFTLRPWLSECKAGRQAAGGVLAGAAPSSTGVVMLAATS